MHAGGISAVYYLIFLSVSVSVCAAWFAVYPLCCSLALLVFALRDSAGGAPKAGAARTRGGTLAGGATRIRGASGSERPRAAMSSPVPLPKEIFRSAERGELQKVVKWLRKGGGRRALPCYSQ